MPNALVEYYRSRLAVIAQLEWASPRRQLFLHTGRSERKGNYNEDHQLQGHVHRRTAGDGKHGGATRR